MTRLSMLSSKTDDHLPPPKPTQPVVTWRHRARGMALIFLGSLIALVLIAGLIELAPLGFSGQSSANGSPQLGPHVLGLFIAGLMTSGMFVLGGVQLLRKGQLGGRFKAVAALILGLLVAALWSARRALG
jgi:hypothetical protein